MQESWVCETPRELRAVAQKLAESLEPGSVVALTGDLGAGKTEFTKGLAAGLGCPAEVTSPTFGLLHEYLGGRLPLFHLDFYRMEGATEVLDLGWDELSERDGVIVVEWPDRFEELIPPEACWVAIMHREGGGREITQARWGSRRAGD